MMDQAQARFCIEGIAAMLHEGWSPVTYVQEDETDYVDLEALLKYLALLGNLDPEQVLLDVCGGPYRGSYAPLEHPGDAKITNAG